MTRSIAERAHELALGERATAVRPLASGRCSTAWLVEGRAGTWVARVPVKDSGRRMTYEVEAHLGENLSAIGHEVAAWRVVDVDGELCSVGRHLAGNAVNYDATWSVEFGRALADALLDLHRMPVSGFGPLKIGAKGLCGLSHNRTAGIVDRWYHASIWPFDDSLLADHPLFAHAPELFTRIEAMRTAIEHAAGGVLGVVHSDLHREHLLVGDTGSLAGLLDFGDAFAGAIAWDFALLNWYYGNPNATLVAARYPDGDQELARGDLLSVAVGLYKSAKNPSDRAVLPRLRRCVEALT